MRWFRLSFEGDFHDVLIDDSLSRGLYFMTCYVKGTNTVADSCMQYCLYDKQGSVLYYRAEDTQMHRDNDVTPGIVVVDTLNKTGAFYPYGLHNSEKIAVMEGWLV